LWRYYTGADIDSSSRKQELIEQASRSWSASRKGDLLAAPKPGDTDARRSPRHVLLAPVRRWS
jgi:hypothetical protein